MTLRETSDQDARRELPRPSGEALRAELRELGYLENPLSRFFVGGLAGQRPILRTHLRSGVGVGVTFGLLVSILVTVALLAQPRSLSPYAGDSWKLVAIASGLGFFACVAVGIAGAIATFAIFRITRRLVDKAELAARISGYAASALVFSYLVLFWIHYGPRLAAGAAVPPAIAHIFAAIAVMLLAGLTHRVFHLATFAVVASIPGYRVGGRRPGARRALVFSISLFATGAAATAFLTAPADETGFSERGDAYVAGTALGSPVILIAIDGLDEEDAAAAMARGWMPELAKIVAGGASRPLATGDAAIPPAFWTTVATGLLTRRHQIDSYLRDRVRGVDRTIDLAGVFSLALGALGLSQEVAVSGAMSRVKRVVDLVGENQRRGVSVNYWATWPIDGMDGVCVSERAWLDLVLDGDDARALDPALRDELRALLPAEDHLPVEVPAIAEADLEGNRATIRPIWNDLFVHRAALHLLAKERPDYLQIGLTGLDILRNDLQRTLGRSTDVRMSGRYLVLESWYRRLDSFLAEVREVAGPDALLCIATYPGISARSADLNGLLVLSGKSVKAGRVEVPLAPESIAPTLLFSLGLPSSEEQDGVPDLLGFSVEALASAARTQKMVAAFGLKIPTAAQDPSSDVYLEHLKQMGYLK